MFEEMGAGEPRCTAILAHARRLSSRAEPTTLSAL
jgi:hypothetical protein